MSGVEKTRNTNATGPSAKNLGGKRRDYEAKFFDHGVQLGEDQFPAQYFARTEADRAVGLKQDYVRSLNQYTPDLNARYDVSQSEIDALVRRYDELDLINFEKSIATWFDTKDPTHQRLINELYPEYFERRIDQIEANLEVQRKVAHLRLLGPRSKEDLRFAYFLETGTIALPTGPVFEPTMTDNDKQRGLFNPFHLFNVNKINTARHSHAGLGYGGTAWSKPGQDSTKPVYATSATRGLSANQGPENTTKALFIADTK